MANLSDPATYRAVYESLIDKGYSPSEIKAALGQRVSTEQAPSAVSGGFRTKQEAFQDVGGLSTPGSVSLFEGVSAPETTEARSAEQAKTIAASKSGLRSAKRIREVLGENEKGELGGGAKLFGATTSFTPWGKGLEADLLNIADAVLRLRTGAAAPEKEIKRFAKIIAPAFFESSATRGQKLTGAEQELIDTLTEMNESFDENEPTEDMAIGGAIGGGQAKSQESSRYSPFTGKANLREESMGLTTDEMGLTTGEEEKSLKGLGQNAITDIQELVKGVVSLPKVVNQLGKELAEERSLFGPGIDFLRTPTGQAIMKGTVEEYKNLITHPLEHSYNHPVNTILDVIPLVAGVKKLTAGRFAKGVKVVDEASDIAKITSKIDELPEIPPKLGLVDDVSKTGGIKNLLPSRPDVASRTFSTAFVVPTKLSKRLNPIGTSAKMLDYGITGSFDDMSKIASTVTGDSGVLTKVTRNVIGGIEGEIAYGETMKAAKNMLDNVVELTPAEETRILRNIAGAEKTGKQVLTVNPLDAYDTAKRLEALGYQYLNTNTYLTGNVKNIGIGKAYLAAVDEIMVQIENAAKGQNVLARYKTPQILQELSEISPKLADEFKAVNTISEVRSLQAPFVRLNKMISITDEAANSAFMSGKVGRVGGGVTGVVGGSLIGGPIGAGIGGILGTLFGPSIEASLQTLKPAILTGTAKILKGGR